MNIMSAVRRAIGRRLHGMVGFSVFLKFRDQGSDFVANCGVQAFEPLSPEDYFSPNLFLLFRLLLRLRFSLLRFGFFFLFRFSTEEIFNFL